MRRFRDRVLAWFADIRVYNFGIILWGDSHYKIKGPHQREILGLLQPGDVLLRRYDHYLGSILLPGYWSHAAIYVGNDHVIHMLGRGITKEDILTFMRTDDICILRCADKARVEQAVRKAEELYDSGVAYDYDFKKSPEKLYCSEFADYVYDHFDYQQKQGIFIYPQAIRNTNDLEYIWSRDKTQ